MPGQKGPIWKASAVTTQQIAKKYSHMNGQIIINNKGSTQKGGKLQVGSNKEAKTIDVNDIEPVMVHRRKKSKYKKMI